METNAETLEKIKKLLRLAQSDNEHEAALAAAKAQELMDRHQIEQAMLSLDGVAEEEDEEDIVHFSDREDALDDFGSKTVTWKGSLGMNIAEHNACTVYYASHQVYGGPETKRLVIVGRPTDVATVRYLYAYCVREIERFVLERGVGHGRTWYNNYRMGIVSAIGTTLRKQREAMRKGIQKEARARGGAAIVKVSSAIAKVDAKQRELETWVKRNLRLRHTSASYTSNRSAFDAGLKDGATINMSGGKSLGAGARKRLGGG